MEVERTTPSLLPGLAQRCIAQGSYFLVVGILYATPTVPLWHCPMDDQVGSPPWMVRTNLQTLQYSYGAVSYGSHSGHPVEE